MIFRPRPIHIKETGLSYFDIVSERPAWSFTQWEKFCETELIRLNSSDMDIAPAPAIRAALADQVVRGTFAATPPPGLSRTLIHYYQRRYDWTIQADWIVWLPGPTQGVNLAVKACCSTDDGAITFSPGDPALSSAPGLQGRELFELALVPRAGATTNTLHYDIDFEGLQTAMPQSSLLQLSNPGNPLGRILDEREIDRLAELCVRHNMYVCSSEADADLVLDGGAAHRPLAQALARRAPALLNRTITLGGSGKAYNVAGIGMGWAIIPDPLLRTRFQEARQMLVPDPGCFAYAALHATLTDSEDWLQETLARLRQNRALVSAALDAMDLPHTEPQAACLTWIDMRKLATRVGKVVPYFERHGVLLGDGAHFGQPGFATLNFACATSLLQQALLRMRKAVDESWNVKERDR